MFLAGGRWSLPSMNWEERRECLARSGWPLRNSRIKVALHAWEFTDVAFKIFFAGWACFRCWWSRSEMHYLKATKSAEYMSLSACHYHWLTARGRGGNSAYYHKRHAKYSKFLPRLSSGIISFYCDVISCHTTYILSYVLCKADER